MHRNHSALVLCSLALLSGCGEAPPEIVPAEGVVTLNGKPLAKAQVRLYPTADLGPGYIAVGVTDDDGKFQLDCSGQAGAPVGDCLITVAESDPPDELLGEEAQVELAKYLRSLKNRPIPRNYASPVSSGLTATITADQGPIELSLTRRR